MLDIVIDPTQLVGTLDAMAERQLPYATARALNELATSFQLDERGVIQGGMTIRRPWVLQGVKIDRADFATKDKLSVRVHIDDARDFLDKFEAGDVKRPTAGGRSISVPIAVRRTKTDIVQKSQRPRSFNFQQGFSSVKSQWTILKGDRHTFLLQRPDGSGLILQRTPRPRLGPSRTGNRNLVARRAWGQDPNLNILWNLRPSVPTPRILHFGETARAAVLSKWPGIFAKWYLQALASAR